MSLNVITLISELSDDETEETEVFAEIDSVGQNEFFAAEQAGFRPEFRAKIWREEYDNETILQLDGKKYDIYRTFECPGGKIELYAQHRVGV